MINDYSLFGSLSKSQKGEAEAFYILFSCSKS